MGFQSFDEYPSEKLVGLEGNATPFAFEKAYCLYRLHQEDKALQLIQSALEQDVEKYGYENDDGRRVGHLKGQILYRSGRFQEAEQVYNDLLASCPAVRPDPVPVMLRNRADFLFILIPDRTRRKLQTLSITSIPSEPISSFNRLATTASSTLLNSTTMRSNRMYRRSPPLFDKRPMRLVAKRGARVHLAAY